MNGIDELRQRRELWIDSFNDLNINSITRQLLELSGIITDFRIVYEARRLAPVDTKEGGVQLSGMLHNLLNQTFYDSVLLRIRKLTEDKYLSKGDDKKKKGRDESVISIVSLLEDIKKNLPLLTRENLFAVEGIEYDFTKLQLLEKEHERVEREKGNTTFFYPPEIISDQSINRHKVLDILCKVEEETRSESDCVDATIIETLKQNVVEATKKIKNIVDKEIAHAATPQSKNEVDVMPVSVSEIVDAYMVLVNIANFIQHAVLNKGTTEFNPLPRKKFQYIEKPLVTIDNIPELEKTYKDFLDEYSNKTIDFDINRVIDFDTFLNYLFES